MSITAGGNHCPLLKQTAHTFLAAGSANGFADECSHGNHADIFYDAHSLSRLDRIRDHQELRNYGDSFLSAVLGL